jgi:diguanylate cyclase (GGDEF)-like protein
VSSEVVALVAAVVLLLLFVGFFWRSMHRARQVELREQKEQLDFLNATRRELNERDREVQLAALCFVEVSHLISQLHSRVSPRLVPRILLSIVMRIFDPKQAVILLRRRRAESEPGREKRFVVVAAARPEDGIEPGVEIDASQHWIGLAAEAQRLMSREDLRKEGWTKTSHGKGPMASFAPELVSPMVFEGESLGLIALSEPKHQSTVAKNVLRLVSQIGAVTVNNMVAYSEMKLSANIDRLTGLYCKAYMHVKLGDLIVEAQQESSCLSIFFFDIDNFKHYNDTNGHGAGDELLRQLSRLVEDNTRQTSTLGRVGGEEFLVIFPGSDKSQAMKAAENIRAKVADHDFPHAEKQPLGILSISGGVATYPEDSMDSAELLRRADQALYQAKESGRNRVLAAETQHLGDENLEPSGAPLEA